MSVYLWKQLVSSISSTSPSSHTHVTASTNVQEEHSQPCMVILWFLWKILVFIFLLLSQISLIIGRLLPAQDTPYRVVALSYTCLGLYAILLGVLIPVEIIELCVRVCGLGSSRQSVLGKQFKIMSVVAVSMFLLIQGLYTASGPVLRRIHVPVHKLPESFNGMTVVHLSDIHLGPTVGRQQMLQVVADVNRLKPDMVVITGDLVESPVESLVTAVQPLNDIKTKYGIYFSTGNHEYHTGAIEQWMAHLEYLGVQCLHNKHVKIKKHGQPSDWFYLVGTDDWHASMMIGGDHKFDLDKAMTDTDQDHAVILMAHQPNAAKAAINSKYDFSLILSGHTHGGQFYPLNIFIYLFNPFYAGLYHVSKHTYVYVSSGTWYYGPPIRISSTPEITHITLRAQNKYSQPKA